MIIADRPADSPGLLHDADDLVPGLRERMTQPGGSNPLLSPVFNRLAGLPRAYHWRASIHLNHVEGGKAVDPTEGIEFLNEPVGFRDSSLMKKFRSPIVSPRPWT